jgi:hypothetical protein
VAESLRDIDAEMCKLMLLTARKAGAYLVCSMTTLKGIRGIQLMKQMTVKMAKIKNTIPPDQYFLDSM